MFLNEIVFELLQTENFIICPQVIRECLKTEKLQLNIQFKATALKFYSIASRYGTFYDIH